MAPALPSPALDQLFRTARTFRYWIAEPVADEVLMELYDLAKMGPTSANSQPMRLVFVRSESAKEGLRPCLDPGNVLQTMAAPVTAIVAYDLDFYETLPRLAPHTDARAWFLGNDDLIRETGFRNSSLQGAYLILAARALGLDCGPMSGFDKAKVDAVFFPEGRVRSNFLINLGYGDPASLRPRAPRLDFAEAVRIE
jgi:3-hydroxypropanoate dehydrogenase